MYGSTLALELSRKRLAQDCNAVLSVALDLDFDAIPVTGARGDTSLIRKRGWHEKAVDRHCKKLSEEKQTGMLGFLSSRQRVPKRDESRFDGYVLFEAKQKRGVCQK